MRVLEMNESAECVIASGATSLRMSNGPLSAASAETDAELRRLVADACSSNADVVPGLGGNLLLPGRADDAAGFGHALTVVPHVRRDELRFLQGRHAVVFIKNLTLALPPDFDRDLRAVFNLSPAEARLAVALASGLSLKDAASQQNIRFSTARSYLEVIFRKTDTRQQSQLVALLKSAQPLTGLD
jgi:DNA-binding CsgD family transcriptional regulator